MGQFLKLKPSQIRPSQEFLKSDTLEFIFHCYEHGHLDELPPFPIVRRDPENENIYVAIDGHNLLAVHEVQNTECDVYLAESLDDYMPNPNDDESISERNIDLKNKYETSATEANRIDTTFEYLFIKHMAEE